MDVQPTGTSPTSQAEAADEGGPGEDPEASAFTAPPPSRRAALIRTGVVVGVLLVVFGVILPRYVDYEEVLAAFAALTPAQLVLMSVLGAGAWLASGLLFTALIPGMSPIRGTVSYLILGGVGASIPLGPWNMGVLWVVVRGWGFGIRPATSGIALYGIVNQLGRLALPLVALIVVLVAGGWGGGWSVAFVIALVSTGILFAAIGVMVAVVRSDRTARAVAATIQRAVTWLAATLGRGTAPDVSGGVYRFRDQLGEVVRRRGRLAMAVSLLGQLAWCGVLVAALRVVGIGEEVLSPPEVLAVFALVSVITIIPISPGGAGVPELLYIAGLSTIAGPQHEAAITAGVFLMRMYQWFLPIPIAWILLKTSRRGRSILPTTTELRTYARDEAA